MGEEMETYQDANLHPGGVDTPDDLSARVRVSVAWISIIVGLVLFWVAAAVAVVTLV